MAKKTIVEELITRLGFNIPAGDEKKFKAYEKGLDSIIGLSVKLAAAAAAAGAALFGAMTIVNQKTTENLRLAKSVGLSIENYEAWADVLDDIGFSGEQTIRMMSDMNRRIGELKGRGEYKEVEDALKSLGVQFKDIKNLAPEEQFLKILNIAKDMSDPQVAAGAVSKLLGRRADQVLGYLRSLNGTMEEILQRSKDVIFLSEAGSEGAARWAANIDFLNTAGTTLGKEFLGLLGGALTPFVEKMVQWVTVNRELIKQKVGEWVEKIRKSVEWLVSAFKRVWPILREIFKRIPGIIKLISIMAGAAAIAKSVMFFMKMSQEIEKVGFAASLAKVKVIGFLAIFAAIFLAVEDIYGFLEGKDSVTGKLLEKAEDWLGIDLVEPIRAAWPGIKEFLGGVFGVVKEVIEKMTTLLAATLNFIISIFTDGFGSALAKFNEDLKREFGDVIGWLEGVWMGFVDFMSGVWDSILGSARGFLSEVKGVLSKIPLVGGVFGSESNIKRGAAGIPRAQSGGTGQPATVQSVRQDVGGITVNAAPGQSPTDVGRAVKRVLEQEMAGAQRALSTGVVR